MRIYRYQCYVKVNTTFVIFEVKLFFCLRPLTKYTMAVWLQLHHN